MHLRDTETSDKAGQSVVNIWMTACLAANSLRMCSAGTNNTWSSQLCNLVRAVDKHLGCAQFAAGFGIIRRIQPSSSPPCPQLYTVPDGLPDIRLRLAVLFGSGVFGVYEVDAVGRLRPGHANPLQCGRAGRLLDFCWAPLPR